MRDNNEAQIASEMGLRLGVRLRSRKNKVYVVSRDAATLILKVYDPEFASHSTTEFSVLSKASEASLAVPRPVDFRERQALLMEYIHGPNLCDLVNDDVGLRAVVSERGMPDSAGPSRSAGRAMAEAAATRTASLPSIPFELAKWFVDFHTATSMLRGDSILRNFVMGSPQRWPEESGPARQENPTARIFGVDFEETRPGDPFIDIGEMVSSLLNTNPMFAPNKVSFCQEFVAAYCELSGCPDTKPIIDEAVRSLMATACRRPRQRSRLLEGAKVLEDEGLRGLRGK